MAIHKRCENTFAANFAKSKQIYAQKTICGDEFATKQRMHHYTLVV